MLLNRTRPLHRAQQGCRLQSKPRKLKKHAFGRGNALLMIYASAASPGLIDYPRPVGALLLFTGSGQLLLLLSEREADALQREVWAASAGAAATYTIRAPANPNVLRSLPYLPLACSRDDSGAASGAAGPHSTAQHKRQQLLYLASALTAAGRSTGSPAELAAKVDGVLCVSSRVAVQLFAGAVMYGSEAQRALLHKRMSGRREAAQELVAWRGQLHMLPRSDLDRACADDRLG